MTVDDASCQEGKPTEDRECVADNEKEADNAMWWLRHHVSKFSSSIKKRNGYFDY